MDKLFIFDTTLRDGEQVPGCQLNTVEKIQVAKQLEALGVDGIEGARKLNSKKILEGYHEYLLNNPMISSLIRKCSYKGNPLKQEHIRFDVTQEANSLFEAAFSLNVLKGVFNLDASVNSLLSKKETITLDIRFDFQQ